MAAPENATAAALPMHGERGVLNEIYGGEGGFGLAKTRF
jgi:hypothetical protein